MSEWSELADNMKSSAMKADLGFSIAELEVALETAVINEPINRAEGLVEQADLELQHAASYREALGLLQSGKSLPAKMVAEIKSCLKGGPGSGPHAGSGTSKESFVHEHSTLLKQGFKPTTSSKEGVGKSTLTIHHYEHEDGREASILTNKDGVAVSTYITANPSGGKKSLKGGPGSGPHRSGVQSEGQKASERAARFTKIAEATGRSSDHLAAYGAHLNAAKANEGTDKGFRHQAASSYHAEQFSQERAGEKDLEANAKNDFIATHPLLSQDRIYG